MKKEGIFIGLAVIDIVYNFECELPKENTKEKISDYYLDVGGPALKAAITYANLGGSATLVSYIGSSSLGLYLKDICKNKGVKIIDLAEGAEYLPNTSCVQIVKARSTRTILSGQREYGDVKKFNFVDLSKYDFCLYDGNLPHLTKALSEEISRTKINLVLDSGNWKRDMESVLKEANIVIASGVFRAPNGYDIFDLQYKYKIDEVAKTNNEQPIAYKILGKESGKIEVEEVKNCNTLGAGDIYHGAFCYYYYQEGKDFKTSLILARDRTREYLLQSDEERRA